MEDPQMLIILIIANDSIQEQCSLIYWNQTAFSLSLALPLSLTLPLSHAPEWDTIRAPLLLLLVIVYKTFIKDLFIDNCFAPLFFTWRKKSKPTRLYYLTRNYIQIIYDLCTVLGWIQAKVWTIGKLHPNLI